MSVYGQYCPISKAVEILGERWTLLLIREMLLGSKRFNELQRGLSRMSPSLLTRRLKDLEQAGLVFRSKISGQNGHEYHLSAAGKELGPLVMELATWGMKWVKDQLTEEDADVEFLMWDIHRNIKIAQLPQTAAIIKFHFAEQANFKNWWLVFDGSKVDLCTDKPADEADLYINTDAYTLNRIWLCEIDWQQALQTKIVEVTGHRLLAKEIANWLGSASLEELSIRLGKS